MYGRVEKKVPASNDNTEFSLFDQLDISESKTREAQSEKNSDFQDTCYD